MRSGTPVAALMRLLHAGMARLLAVALIVALAAPAVAGAKDVHVHAAQGLVTAEAPAPDASGTHQDDACLICHIHCGCHLGVAEPAPDDGLRTADALRLTSLPTSDDRLPSAQSAQLIRPPRA